MRGTAVAVAATAIVVLSIAVPAAGMGGASPTHDDASIRIVSYNVLGGRNTDGARDLDRVARVINALEPDIVALQEVDRGTGRLGGLDLASELGERTGMAAWFGAAMEYDGGEYGEAVLSRLPVSAAQVHALPRTGEREPRAALALRVATPGGCEFVFVGTHFDHEPPHSDRVAQAHELARILRSEYGDAPVVVAGDLNAEPGSPPLEVLSRVSVNAWEAPRVPGASIAAPGPTFPASAPVKRIDHVLLRPAVRWAVAAATTGDRFEGADNAWRELLVLASDHLPVVVDLHVEGCGSR